MFYAHSDFSDINYKLSVFKFFYTFQLPYFLKKSEFFFLIYFSHLGYVGLESLHVFIRLEKFWVILFVTAVKTVPAYGVVILFLLGEIISLMFAPPVCSSSSSFSPS